MNVKKRPTESLPLVTAYLLLKNATEGLAMVFVSPAIRHVSLAMTAGRLETQMRDYFELTA